MSDARQRRHKHHRRCHQTPRERQRRAVARGSRSECQRRRQRQQRQRTQRRGKTRLRRLKRKHIDRAAVNAAAGVNRLASAPRKLEPSPAGYFTSAGSSPDSSSACSRSIFFPSPGRPQPITMPSALGSSVARCASAFPAAFCANARKYFRFISHPNPSAGNTSRNKTSPSAP